MLNQEISTGYFPVLRYEAVEQLKSPPRLGGDRAQHPRRETSLRRVYGPWRAFHRQLDAQHLEATGAILEDVEAFGLGEREAGAGSLEVQEQMRRQVVLGGADERVGEGR
jgi:hypothetical protein